MHEQIIIGDMRAYVAYKIKNNKIKQETTTKSSMHFVRMINSNCGDSMRTFVFGSFRTKYAKQRFKTAYLFFPFFFHSKSRTCCDGTFYRNYELRNQKVLKIHVLRMH